MKKASRKKEDLRREYKRSDFGALVRGKYAHRASAATKVVVLQPRIARAVPDNRT
jgi:hypothetical protein